MYACMAPYEQYGAIFMLDECIIKKMPLDELRSLWAQEWGRTPHVRLGRKMLERSVLFKLHVRQFGNALNDAQEARLKRLVEQYKRSPVAFDSRRDVLKAGTRLVREYGGKKHVVTVTEAGFIYAGKAYGSLSKIAGDITGKNWNGWLFFGLK